MGQERRLEQLREFADSLSSVYSAIGHSLTNIVEHLNASINDEEVRRSIEELVASLEVFERKVLVEQQLTDKGEILRILRQQVVKIRKLESYLLFAKRHPDHKVIRAISDLHRDLERLFAQEQVVLRKAA